MPGFGAWGARRIAVPFLEQVSRWLDEEADERQLGTSARGLELAFAMVAKTRGKDPEAPPPVHPQGLRTTGLRDVVEVAYRSRTADKLGLPTTPLELEALLALEGTTAPEDRRNPVPVGDETRALSVP